MCNYLVNRLGIKTDFKKFVSNLYIIEFIRSYTSNISKKYMQKINLITNLLSLYVNETN